MKKISILGLCLLSASATIAQTGLVKDVESKIKSSVDKYPALLEELKPAFTNPETAEGAYVWFVAGKGGMDFFDNQQALKEIGKEVKDHDMGHALINSYGYLTTALKNDTVVNEKGKVKTKYSKDIVKLINSHYNDFNVAAIYLWGVQDYNGAYDSWKLYTSIPNDPVLGNNRPQMPADTIMADINFNMALAAWQSERLQDAMDSFEKSMALGYNKKQIYDYAISVASGLNDTKKMAELAEKAYPLYGNEDSRYIGFMINDKIQNKQFDEAQTMLAKYISDDPDNAQLYYVLGVLYDSQNNFPEAMANYKKAIELDPANAQALMQYGRQLCNKAYMIDDEASTKSTTEYNRIRTEEVNPLFKEASQYLEKAYELDPENTDDALRFLRNIYYNLGDEDNLKRIESL